MKKALQLLTLRARTALTVLFVLASMGIGVAAGKNFTLVIDAGHGGHDAGAKGSKAYEKNINLSVALAFGKYVERNCPDVKVVYTRKTDVFIPLHERAEIANKAKANLFISVHTNALPGGRIARGFETYTLGDGRSHGTKTNLDVAKRENSVIYMEKDYKQHYVGFDPNSDESNIMFEFVQDHNMQQSVEFAKMLQRNVCSTANRPNKGVHQDNFAVLRLTSMPACLIELGFITTPDEEQTLTNSSNVDLIARGIYNAFAEYKNKQGGSTTVPFETSAEPLPTEETAQSKTLVEQTAEPEMLPTERNQHQEAQKSTLEAQNLQQIPAQKLVRATQRRAQEARIRAQKQPQIEAHVDDDGIIIYDENAGKPAVRVKNGEEIDTSAVSAGTETKAEAKIAEKQETAIESKEAPIESVTTTTESTTSIAEATANDAASADVPVFKIQILMTPKPLAKGDAAFKGLEGYSYYTENGNTKYTYGESTDLSEISRLRRTIVDKFPTCFIIAFKNGVRTDVTKAVSEWRANKRKK